MKSFLSLLFALLIVGIFGGTAYFYWDISNNVKFDRKAPQSPDTISTSPTPSTSSIPQTTEIPSESEVTK